MKAVAGARGVSCCRHCSVKSIFELFFIFSLRVSPCYALLSPVLSGSCLSPPRHFRESLCSLSPNTTPLVVHSPAACFSKRPASERSSPIATPLHPALQMPGVWKNRQRSEEHTSELQSRLHLVCR